MSLVHLVLGTFTWLNIANGMAKLPLATERDAINSVGRLDGTLRNL